MYKDIVNNLELFKIEIPKTIVPVPSENDYEALFALSLLYAMGENKGIKRF